jgi:hypothetical protein
MPTVARFLGAAGKSAHFCDQMQLSPICRKSQTSAPQRQLKGKAAKAAER